MASAAGYPLSLPLQDNFNAERHLQEAQDRLREAIEELQICLIIGFSSQDSRWVSFENLDTLSLFCVLGFV